MENATSPNAMATVKTSRKTQELGTFVDGVLISDDEKKSKIRWMYLAAVTCLLMAVAMGFAVGYSAPATYDMTSRRDSSIKPTQSEVSWIGSTLALGAVIGGLCAGPVADKLGRKEILVFNIVPFGLGWFIISYASTVLELIIGRFICGFACGVVSVTVPMYCVEIATADVRGILGSAFQGFLVIGSLLSALIGLYVNWSVLAMISAAVAIVGVICFLRMPESPRWFLAKGKLNAAIYVMEKLQGKQAEVGKECNAIYNELQGQPKGLLSFEECRNPAVYKPTVIVFFLMFFQQFSGANSVLFYSTSIFETSKAFMDPKKATVILGAVQVIATLIGNVTVDKLGRKVLLIASGILMAFSLIFLGTYYYKSSFDLTFRNSYGWIPLVSLIIFIIAFSIGYGSIPWLLAAEMVPVRARSTVSGIATIANGLFAFIVTKTFSALVQLLHDYGTFWFYSCVSILGTVFVILMLPETKGKKLEEIEKIFDKSDIKQTEQIDSISVTQIV